jgi:hypothetical protein
MAKWETRNQTLCSLIANLSFPPFLLECLRFFRNKFYIPVFFSQTWKNQNLEIVCVRIILFLSFLFCVLAV